MEKIGKYGIVRKLGQGGMGIVYLCRDAESSTDVAIKMLPRQLADNPVFFQRFKREVQTLQRLDHPCVVKVYDRGMHDGAPWYAMEYVPGVSLANILEKQEKMAPPRAIAIIRACAEALEHAHAQGVIHRDIKPANILLADDGIVKLTDFGIAKVLDATRMTVTQSVLGTVEYMSPEQSQGRNVDARTDLYSLGVVLYQCLTARLPVTGTTPSEVILKLRTHQVESPDAWVPGLPKRLVELIMRLLEKDPLKRPESARELIRELDIIRRQLERGIEAHRAAVTSKPLLTGGYRSGYALLRSPWLYIFLLLGAIILFVALSNNEPATAPEPTAGTGTSRIHVRFMLTAARRHMNRKNFEYAADLCRLVQKHFPKLAEEEGAGALLQKIEKAKAANTAGEGPEKQRNSSPAQGARKTDQRP